MQPEVKDKQKQEITPIEQWDHLAFQVIYNELAPNGFNRGVQYVKVTKKSVVNTQKIAAQLIRGFRNKLQKEFNEMQLIRETKFDEAQRQLNACWFWQFRKKRKLQEEVIHYRAGVGHLEIVKGRLETTEIK